MEFQWYWALPFLALVPLLVVGYIWALRRRARFALRYPSLALVNSAIEKKSNYRRHVPPFMFLMAITTMLFAFARPSAVIAYPRQESTVILTIDCSASMSTADLKPNRIEAAKAAARAFVEEQNPMPMIGVVAFSESASLVQQPTTDRNAVLHAINYLYPDTTTAIGSGILTSLDAIFQQHNYASITPTYLPEPVPHAAATPVAPGTRSFGTIILLTDGQNVVGPAPLDAATEAARRGVRIYTIGVGKPVAPSDPGAPVYTKYDELDETTLTQVAQMTDGKYFRATDSEQLASIYKNLDSQVVIQKNVLEITPGLTAFAVLLVLVGSTLSFRWSSGLP